MSVVLAHETVEGAEPTRNIMILHGILGSGRNWRTIANRLVERHPELRVVLPDLRNHGGSRSGAPPHDLDACARDVAALCDHLDIAPDAILGHSFGGKVALVAASRMESVRSVWVLDAPLGAGPGRGDVESVIETIREIAMPVKTRGDLVAAAQHKGLPKRLAQWLTTNLEQADGGLDWRFDLDGVVEMLESYRDTDAWPLAERPREGLSVHVVVGGRSDRWDDADLERLAVLDEEGHLHLARLPDAGHWLHADDPDGLLTLLGDL